jgi:hypothetical protein
VASPFGPRLWIVRKLIASRYKGYSTAQQSHADPAHRLSDRQYQADLFFAVALDAAQGEPDPARSQVSASSRTSC